MICLWVAGLIFVGWFVLFLFGVCVYDYLYFVGLCDVLLMGWVCLACSGLPLFCC